MKSSITSCNSNDQLLQLVPIQLLQKAYFKQLMFQGADYPTVDLFPSFAEVTFSSYLVYTAILDLFFVIIHFCKTIGDS